MDFIASLDPLAWLVIIVPAAALLLILLSGMRSAKRVAREQDRDADDRPHS